MKSYVYNNMGGPIVRLNVFYNSYKYIKTISIKSRWKTNRVALEQFHCKIDHNSIKVYE